MSSTRQKQPHICCKGGDLANCYIDNQIEQQAKRAQNNKIDDNDCHKPWYHARSKLYGRYKSECQQRSDSQYKQRPGNMSYCPQDYHSKHNPGEDSNWYIASTCPLGYI